MKNMKQMKQMIWIWKQNTRAKKNLKRQRFEISFLVLPSKSSHFRETVEICIVCKKRKKLKISGISLMVFLESDTKEEWGEKKTHSNFQSRWNKWNIVNGSANDTGSKHKSTKGRATKKTEKKYDFNSVSVCAKKKTKKNLWIVV